LEASIWRTLLDPEVASVAIPSLGVLEQNSLCTKWGYADYSDLTALEWESSNEQFCQSFKKDERPTCIPFMHLTDDKEKEGRAKKVKHHVFERKKR